MDFFFRYFFFFFLIRELHSAVKNGEHFASCNNTFYCFCLSGYICYSFYKKFF